ncbi:TolC family protein [Methylobacterium persicinum]|uniref:Outer membrane protein TolC n=1 Tax=Methylobacterium persicinum TaxID=374426 RepID=A0ABU0HPL4_9HYPH|nr:TolC family protein [Methylobacterium persicinum]MDQ0444225.1 outer membrane protein TolC [Methylobacterium persicinum]GJE39611.1 hypothetical protein KHHGKMAE_3695 [Methylobacterium persicinum]
MKPDHPGGGFGRPRNATRSAAKPAPLRTVLTAAGLAAAGLLGAAEAGADAQSLSETMHWALRSSFDKKADDERQAAAEARMLSSYEAFLPEAAYVINHRLDSTIRYKPDVYTDPSNPTGTDTVGRRQPSGDGFQLTLPLFDGFRRSNTLEAARSAVAAGRGLQDVKTQQILLETASAYLAVLRDRAVVRLREAAIADVAKVARSVAARREVHDATNAELALAESRVIAAQAALEQARANLLASDAELERLAGPDANPSALPDVPNRLLPKSLDELRAVLLGESPRLIAARLDAESADYLAKAAYARFSPQLNLQFNHTRRGWVSNTPYKVVDTTTMLQAVVPLYQPGEFGDLARDQALARQKSYETLDLERRVVAEATVAFTQRRSSLQQVAQASERVRKLIRAVQGRQMELRLGTMTILDTLNTVGELADARIAKINLEYSRDRATYALAAAMNRLRV